MRTHNTKYRNKKQLQEFIEKYNLYSTENLLIQVFTMESRARISRLLTFLNSELPNASIIGATVDASICDELVADGTVLSFTVFEKATVKGTAICSQQIHSTYEIGSKLIDDIVGTDTKAIILFGDSHKLDSRGLLTALEEKCPDILIAGGNNIGTNHNRKGFLISKTGLLESGVVAVSLDGDELRASFQKSSEWNAAGRAFTVTDAGEHRISQLDHRPVRDIYDKYLGKNLTSSLEGADSPFPLMVKKGDELKPVMVAEFHSDGSISVLEPVEKGSIVYIGYGDAGIFLNSVQFIFDQLKKVPAQSVFMYSCLTRRRFFKKGIDIEINAFQQLLPTAGAFTAGEYFHEEGKNVELSYALTFLVLSEEDVYIDEHAFESIEASEFQDLLSLSQLIKASTEELEALNKTLKESEQRYKSLFDHNPDVVYAMDLNGNITSVNETMEKILGYDVQEVIGENSLSFVIPEERDRVSLYFKKSLQNQPQHFTTLVQQKNGQSILFDIANIPIKVNEQVVGVFGIAKDLAEKVQAQKKITQLAYHDSLTGLPNRLFFHERLTESIERADDAGEKLAVLFVDLDEFKMINDSLGHQSGDKILKHIGKSLSHLMRDGLFLARFGADEFLILVPDVGVLEQLPANILNVLKKPIVMNGKDYVLSGSIGISVYPEDARDGEQLLKNANIAMHRAKLTGRNSVEYFTSDMNDTIVERLEMENHLRKAMEMDELEIYYQPQINLTDGNVFACEALLRWNHTKTGLIPPNQFIPVAEDAGLIIEIGRWVLEQACKQVKSWHDQGMDHLSISVNVSGKQFQRLEFKSEVEDALRESGLRASALHIELTESIMLENVPYSVKLIEELRSLGVKISVDDFGTGYSSLSYLKDFQIDILKIDQTFIRNLEEKSSDAAIVKAIITMCEGLGITVLAEGVETEQQLKTLKKFGCNQIQGYYISKPVVPAQIEQFLLKNKVM